MDAASAGRRSLRAVLLLAAAYLLIGIAFAELPVFDTTNAMHVMWRRLAWVVSGIGFAAHIAYGHFRLGNSPHMIATHASIAAALGACGLALAANVHEWKTASSFRPSIAIALIAWPLLIAVPAFVAAIVAAYALNRWCRRA